jgi:hypothetical protein
LQIPADETYRIVEIREMSPDRSRKADMLNLWGRGLLRA